MPDVTHRAILSGLSPEARLRLTERSNRAGLLHLAGHALAIAAASALILLRIPLWPLLLPAQGVLIMFLFTLLHETVHDTPFRSAWLNRAVGRVAGFLVLAPPIWFRYFHLAHHRHTHDPARDPELAEPKPATRAAYLIHLSGLPAWRAALRTMLGNARRTPADPWLPAAARPRVQREARIYLALYALAAAAAPFAPAILWLWVMPALLGQPFLRAYLLAEHTRCPHVADMLENTRTTFTGALVRFVAWNMPYHAEHHTYPAVPFHRLPEFHRLVQAHLRQTAPGYAAFNAGLWDMLAHDK